MVRTSLVSAAFITISAFMNMSVTQAQTSPVLMDQTDWSRQQVEAETRRVEAERMKSSDAFIAAQEELAEQQETRRRMSMEEDRRLGPDRGGDMDPLRGREDTNRQIEAIRQRADNERGP